MFKIAEYFQVPVTTLFVEKQNNILQQDSNGTKESDKYQDNSDLRDTFESQYSQLYVLQKENIASKDVIIESKDQLIIELRKIIESMKK